MEEKRFGEWMSLKERIHFGDSVPKIKEGDIWWCSCGENVGIEINGKNELFSRPVFVYKKQNIPNFLKLGRGYCRIYFSLYLISFILSIAS